MLKATSLVIPLYCKSLKLKKENMCLPMKQIQSLRSLHNRSPIKFTPSLYSSCIIFSLQPYNTLSMPATCSLHKQIQCASSIRTLQTFLSQKQSWKLHKKKKKFSAYQDKFWSTAWIVTGICESIPKELITK